MGTARALRWALVVGGLAGGCNADAVKGVELEQPPQEECFARGPDGALALRSG
ncbi:MAG: hypothetical protein JKY37_30175 [Nannocystaceae bacterium]|nr:hypothetical protein [Nannocystaceae bacterium]